MNRPELGDVRPTLTPEHSLIVLAEKATSYLSALTPESLKLPRKQKFEEDREFNELYLDTIGA